MEFELFQTMFFKFFLRGWRALALQLAHQQIILMMPAHQVPVMLVRLHQMRFDFFLGIPVHSGHVSLSGVAAPCYPIRRAARWEASLLLLKCRRSHRLSN